MLLQLLLYLFIAHQFVVLGLSPASPVRSAFPLVVVLLLGGVLLKQLVLEQHLDVLRRRRCPLGRLLGGKDAVWIEGSKLPLGLLQNPQEVEVQFTVRLEHILSLLQNKCYATTVPWVGVAAVAARDYPHKPKEPRRGLRIERGRVQRLEES